MTRSEFIERRDLDAAGGGGKTPGMAGAGTRKWKRQLIITAVISLLIGISIGILAVHLLSGTAPAVAGQWRQYARF